MRAGIPARTTRAPERRESLRAALGAGLLLFAAACSGGLDGVGESGACTTDQQCPSGQTCFLNQCRGSSSALTTVLAEVRPPPGGAYGIEQVGQIDLRSSVIVSFSLSAPLNVSGQVVQSLGLNVAQGTAPIAGASVSFAARNPVIPDRPLQASVQATADGTFSTQLPMGTWDATVVPPPPLPPLYEPLGLTGNTASLQILAPANLAMLPVHGDLTAGAQPLAGARVLAVDETGKLLAAAALSDALGGFDLLLPPSTTAFYLRVGPPSDDGSSDAGIPLIPSYSAVGPFSALTASLTWDFGTRPAAATLSGTVVDGSGAQVPRARVYALSLDGQGYVFSNSVTTDASGAFQLPLLEGQFAIEAAPTSGANSPALSAEMDLQVTPSGAPITLTCLAQVQASGRVLAADGTAAPSGTQISATRLPDRLVSSRVAATTPTDANGNFSITADPGQYRLDVAPPASSGLPGKEVVIDLEAGSATLSDIVLAQPLQVVGTVVGSSLSGNTPLAGATVEFFALDSTSTRSISLGTGITDSSGRYRAVLPDVSDPQADDDARR